MLSSITYKAPQNLDADDKHKPRGLDDSQGTLATVFSDEDIDHEDERPSRPTVVIHEDDSAHFNSLTRVESNLEDLILAQEVHQSDVAGGIYLTKTNRNYVCNQVLALKDDMVTIKEESHSDSEGGVGVLQDNTGETVVPQEQAKNPSKRKVHWGSVLVRDYPMVLGDHPCCSYGPPLTLDWEYQEYTPLDVDTYEFYHPPRRIGRELGRNYYNRKHLLSFAGFTKADFKKTKKEINRVKRHRSITRSVAAKYPILFKVEDAVESAGRKFKRLLNDDHWKSQKSLFKAM